MRAIYRTCSCQLCSRDLDGSTCNHAMLAVDGRTFARLPVAERCTDCLAPQGGWHHNFCDQDRWQFGSIASCLDGVLVLDTGYAVIAADRTAAAWARQNRSLAS